MYNVSKLDMASVVFIITILIPRLTSFNIQGMHSSVREKKALATLMVKYIEIIV